MGWRDDIERKLDDALDDVKETIGERLEQTGTSLFGNGSEELGGGEITLTVDGLPLEPYALSADSSLSQISEYRFYCAVAVGVEAGSFLDKPAQWRCTSADGLNRDYAGKVTRIDQGRILPDGQEEWVLTVSSGLAALRQQSRYRIVHRRTVIELAEELLQEYGLTVDNRTHEYYPAMDWTAQVGETDLQFLQRLLARDGIWFYSTLAEQGEVIVLADDQHGASRADRGELAVTAETGGSRSVAGHAMVALRQSRRYYRWQPDRSRVHQQVCPSEAAALTQESQSSAGKVATQQTFFQSGSGDAHASLTQARLEQERQQCRSHTILASGAVGDLQVGQWLPVAGHGPCLITRAALTFSSPRNHQGNSPNGFSWEAELLPLAQPFRPALPTQISLPLVFPARVEAGGPYSHVDGMASRKARIDFDDGDQPLTESSPPLRQLQPHGSLPGKDGQATGWDWPLRNGAEVLLTCLNNDPDKPLILGYAPAASQPGPVSNRNAPENRILTPAGHLLNLNDRKEAQAITLNTPDGQCLLDLNANSESPLVTLACEQGALVMRAGQHQNIDVGKNSQIRIGSDSTTQVLNSSVIHTDSGVIHHQSQTSTHLTATANAALKSGKNLELYSAANSQLRVQGSATITARKGLASKVGGDLQLQASDAIDIRGDGSGNLTLHQGGGGITIKKDGTIRLFGNTVTLKGGSGVTFNGNHEYAIPQGLKADKPVPAPIKNVAGIEALDMDPEWQGNDAARSFISVRWQNNQHPLSETAFASLRARGLRIEEPLEITVVEQFGNSETVVDSWQYYPDQSAGNFAIEWQPRQSLEEIELKEESKDPLSVRRYLLKVKGNNGEITTIEPMELTGNSRFSPVDEDGVALPDGTGAMLEDANGVIHEGLVQQGTVSFTDIPLGQVSLSFNHYVHISESEISPGDTGEGDSPVFRQCSLVELCAANDPPAPQVTCQIAPIEDFLIIPSSSEVVLLTGMEVRKIEKLESYYNEPVLTLQQAIKNQDQNAIAEAKKELEKRVRTPPGSTGNGSDCESSDDSDEKEGGVTRSLAGSAKTKGMAEIIRPANARQFSFIPSDALESNSQQGERRYTVAGLRDSLAYGLSEDEVEEDDRSRKEKIKEMLKKQFRDVKVEFKYGVKIEEKKKGQIPSEAMKGVFPLLDVLPDSWFGAIDSWVADINEKCKGNWELNKVRRDAAVDLLNTKEDYDFPHLGKAKDNIEAIWEGQAKQPDWYQGFLDTDDLEDSKQYIDPIKSESLPPSVFKWGASFAMMRYVAGASASADIDLMNASISAEAKAEMSLALLEGKADGQFMLPDADGWHCEFAVKREKTIVTWSPVESIKKQEIPTGQSGSFPKPALLKRVNRALVPLKADSVAGPVRVKALGRDDDGSLCPERSAAIQAFLLGDIGGWLMLFDEGVWGDPEKRFMEQDIYGNGAEARPADNLQGILMDNLSGLLGLDQGVSPTRESLRDLIIAYFRKYRVHSCTESFGFFNDAINTRALYDCPVPLTEQACQLVPHNESGGTLFFVLFRARSNDQWVDEKARLGQFRLDLSGSISGFAGAQLAAAGKVYLNPKEGAIEAYGLSSDSPWPDDQQQVSGMIQGDNLPAPLPVSAPEASASPTGSSLSKAGGSEVKLEAFAGAKATLGIKGALMWKKPDEGSDFGELGSVGWSGTALAGIAASGDFKIGFDMRTGRFVVKCRAEVGFAVGVGGGFAFTVDAFQIYDLFRLVYRELENSDFNIIDIFENEGELTPAFDAFCAFQYELFKHGGVAGVMVGSVVTGGLLAVSAVQSVSDLSMELLERWSEYHEESEDAHKLADSVLSDSMLLDVALPETKGRILETLTTAGTTWQDIDWDWTWYAGLFSSTVDEKRENAVMKVVNSINSRREYQEVMEHMGVNIPVGDSGANKRMRVERNAQRLLAMLDGDERKEFESINSDWLG